jgi:methionyl aminopeptidase
VRTVSVETPEELAGLRRAGRAVAATVAALHAAVEPGITTAELDGIAARVFAEHGARSGPILTYGYPGSVCLSVDDEVVHGIPGPRVLRAGEVVTLDVAAEVDGYHADAATTVPVGRPDGETRRLIAAARAALDAGMRAAQPGAMLRDVGAAIERVTEARGFRVVRELTGHGIGRAMHEAPTVYNWPAPGATSRLTAGMVFTVEPMIVAGTPRISLDPDGWTFRTTDGGRSAHEEHTIVVADGGPVVLTAAG